MYKCFTCNILKKKYKQKCQFVDQHKKGDNTIYRLNKIYKKKNTLDHPFQGPNVIFVRVKSLSRLPEPSGNFSTPFNNILLAAMNMILYVLLKEKVVISASAHEFHNFISVNTSSLILSYTERPLYSETLL